MKRVCEDWTTQHLQSSPPLWGLNTSYGSPETTEKLSTECHHSHSGLLPPHLYFDKNIRRNIFALISFNRHAQAYFHIDPYRSYIRVCTHFYVCLSIPVYQCTCIFPDILCMWWALICKFHIQCVWLWIRDHFGSPTHENHHQLLLISFSYEDIVWGKRKLLVGSRSWPSWAWTSPSHLGPANCYSFNKYFMCRL